MIKDFIPFAVIPVGVKLTIYGSETNDIDMPELKKFMDDVARGQEKINIDRVFQFDEIVEAHRYMEESRACGKLVVVVD